MAKPLFENQAVWITGGGSGIGAALALAFARQGANVAVSGRRLERLEQVAEAVNATGTEGLAVVCDVTDDNSVAEAVARVTEQFGKLDVAVANAGFAVSGKIEDLSLDDWRRQFDTNVFGALSTINHALPALRESGGRLGLMCSVASMIASPKSGAYTASKYALRGIGQTLAIELAGSGVSCTLLHPGFVASEIVQVDNSGERDASRPDRRPKKLIWSAEAAAKVCVKALHRREREFTFTGHGKFGAFIGKHLPGLAHRVMTKNRGWSAGKKRQSAN